MRNLKRVLSLALAAMMLIGMMVITSSAAEATGTSFADADEIQNTEAVDVMVALGVLTGDAESPTFRPNDTLTRAEAAVIVSRMLFTPERAANLTATVQLFDDVPVGYWGAPYIEYCYNLGIIAGNGDGTFDPEGTLTTAAFGKMMLVALGYDAGNQGWLGAANWESLVNRDMIKAGIDVSGTIATESLSRDNTAQMAFQTLTADMVEYATQGTQIDLTGIGTIITTPSPATKVTASNSVAGYDDSYDEVVQFCEQYFADLKKTTGENDDFGRPGSTWSYQGEDITFEANEAAAAFEGRFTYRALYNAVGRAAVNNAYTFNFYADGDDSVGGVYRNGGGSVGYTYDETTLDADKTKTQTQLGERGMTTEVYVDAANTTVDIVMINTYVAKIGSYTAAKGDNSAYITLANVTGGSAVTGLDTKTFNTAVFNEDDVDAVVLFTIAKGGDGKTYPATVEIAVSDEVVPTYLNASDNTFRVDRTTYNYSLKAVGSVAAADVTNAVEKLIYFDNSNNVIFVTGATASSTNYAVVLDHGSNGLVSNGALAQLLFTDGTIDTVRVSADASALDGKIVTYEVNKSDVYTLTETGTKATGGATPADGIITQGRPTITGIANKAANSKTIFLINTATSGEAKYVAYTGIANVPTIKAAPDNVKYASNGSVLEVVYVGTVNEITGAENENSQVLFVAKEGAKTITDSLGTYKQYNAVIDGEIGTVNVQSSALQTTISGGDKLFGTAYYDEDDLLSNALVMSSINASGTGLINATGYLAPVDGTIQLGYTDGDSYTYDENTLVFTVNNQGRISATSFNDLEDDTNHIVLASATKYVLDYVFITNETSGVIVTPNPDPVEEEVTDTSDLGGTEAGGYTFDATSTDGDAPSTTVTLSTAVLGSLAGANSSSGASLAISTDHGDVTLPAYIFTNKTNSVDEAVNVVVEEADVSEIDSDVPEGTVVFGFSISLEKASDNGTVPVADLTGDNRITYTTTITKNDGTHPEDVEVYFVNSQGANEKMDATYVSSSGSLTVYLTHLSTFAVVEKDAQAPSKTAAATATPTTVSVAKDGTATVTITKNDSAATLTVASANEATATAALEGTTLTITGVAAGSTNITITVTGTDEDNYTYSNITITVEVTDGTNVKTAAATADKTAVTVAKDGTATVTITKNDTNATLTATSVAEGTATAELSGTTLTITGVAAGSTTVTIAVSGTNEDNYTYSNITINVTVTDGDTEEFTVTFDVNGATGYTAPTAQTVAKDGVATEPTDTGTATVGTAGADWKRLIGWTTDAEGNSAFDFTTKITANTTLYAKWQTEEAITAGTDGTLTVADNGGNVTCTAPNATVDGNTVVTYYNTTGAVTVSGIKNSSKQADLESNSDGLFKDETKLASDGSITNPGTGKTIYVTFVEYDAQGYVVAVNQKSVEGTGTASTQGAQEQG